MSSEIPSLESLVLLGPEEAAGAWAERFQRDGPEADEHVFRQWLAASDENRSAWQRVCGAWTVFDEAPDLSSLEDMRREALAFRPRRAAARWMPAAVAASVALIVGSVTLHNVVDRGWNLASTHRSPVASGRPVFVAYATQVGQTSPIRLSDGTRMTLDTDSEVDVALTKGARLARLVRGQAFFDVAHDASHPFRIAAGGRVLTDLGTRFNVLLKADEVRVFLQQGSLGVSRGQDPANPEGAETERLAPGQQLVARADRPDQIEPVDGTDLLLWRDGQVRFDSSTIGEAASELNRYSTRKLIIQDPRVAKLRIGGTFRSGDTAGFAKTVSELYSLQAVQRDDGGIELKVAG